MTKTGRYPILYKTTNKPPTPPKKKQLKDSQVGLLVFLNNDWIRIDRMVYTIIRAAFAHFRIEKRESKHRSVHTSGVVLSSAFSVSFSLSSSMGAVISSFSFFSFSGLKKTPNISLPCKHELSTKLMLASFFFSFLFLT